MLNSQRSWIFCASIPTFKNQSYKYKKKFRENFLDHCLDPVNLIPLQEPFINLAVYTWNPDLLLTAKVKKLTFTLPYIAIARMRRKFGVRRGWVANATHRPSYHWERKNVPNVEESGWAAVTVRNGGENLTPKGFDPRTSLSVGSRYTEWAIPAHGLRFKRR